MLKVRSPNGIRVLLLDALYICRLVAYTHRDHFLRPSPGRSEPAIKDKKPFDRDATPALPCRSLRHLATQVGLHRPRPPRGDAGAEVRNVAVELRRVGRRQPSGFAKEDHLCSQELTRDGGITHWVLAWNPARPGDEKGPEGGRPVLASCDTIRKRVLVASRSEAGQVEVQARKAYCIFSVFVRPEYRNRGYARRLMEELKEHLNRQASAAEEKPLFSIVYSDIGKVSGSEIGCCTHLNAQPASIGLLCSSWLASLPILTYFAAREV